MLLCFKTLYKRPLEEKKKTDICTINFRQLWSQPFFIFVIGQIHWREKEEERIKTHITI